MDALVKRATHSHMIRREENAMTVIIAGRCFSIEGEAHFFGSIYFFPPFTNFV